MAGVKVYSNEVVVNVCVFDGAAGIKVYSTCCPNSTDRIVGITGKRKVVVGCVEEIIELLQSVSSQYFWQTCIWPVIVIV